MKRFTRTFPLILAAALQVLPLLRNLVTSPAASSSFAIILRWGLGSTAALGAVDAVSGASGTYMNTSSNITGTVGVPLSTSVNFVINGGNTANTVDDFIFVNTKVNNTGVSSLPLFNNAFTNLALPPGLTIKCVVVNGATNISGLISGTPTSAVTTNISITAGYVGGYTFTTNLHLVIATGAAASPPVITNHPAGLTTVAGGNAVFGVVAGLGPLSYQWKFNTNTVLLNATNATLALTNIRASQAGTYSVTITNASGATNSFQALLVVTNPLPPTFSSASPPAKNGGVFQFTFVPVTGLTNTVLASGVANGGNWSVLTNVPPPATASPVTVSDPISNPSRFYRILIQP